MEEESKPNAHLEFVRIMIRRIKAIYTDLDKQIYEIIIKKLWILCDNNLSNHVKITDDIIKQLYLHITSKKDDIELKKESIDIKKENINLKKESIDIKKENINLKKEQIISLSNDKIKELLINLKNILNNKYSNMLDDHLNKMINNIYKIMKNSNDYNITLEKIEIALKMLIIEIPKELFYLNDAVRIMTFV